VAISHIGTPTLKQLERALADDELSFNYQPFVSLLTGRPAGAEALVRWNRSDGSVTLPDDFIPLAERENFISEITLHMIPRLLADWFLLDGMDRDFALSMNISAQDLSTDRLINFIETAIDRNELDPCRLGIEITESSMLQSNALIRKHLRVLGDMGVSLIMDDYGKGFSSIDTLSQWPFNCIKLDRALIGRMGDSAKSVRIVSASIRMAHELDLSVVAEGVQSVDCYEFLMRAGCSRAQGDWIAPALPLPELLEFMQHHYCWQALPEGLLHLAQLDHIQWRRALINAVTRMAFGDGYSAEERLTDVPEMDYHKCGLGQWYYGPGREFSSNPVFAELEPVHRQLHELGTELIRAAKSGESHVRLTGLMRELSRVSIEVIALLQDLENSAALSSEKRISYKGFCGRR
jgi:EAL domain-containing protein (putative c-di-GMP-specific phosphodiesterase class I)